MSRPICCSLTTSAEKERLSPSLKCQAYVQFHPSHREKPRCRRLCWHVRVKLVPPLRRGVCSFLENSSPYTTWHCRSDRCASKSYSSELLSPQPDWKSLLDCHCTPLHKLSRTPGSTFKTTIGLWNRWDSFSSTSNLSNNKTIEK